MWHSEQIPINQKGFLPNIKTTTNYKEYKLDSRNRSSFLAYMFRYTKKMK